MRKIIYTLILLSACILDAASFDYKALLNPDNYKQMDTSYYSRGKRVADIAYDAISLQVRRKTFNMNIPQTVVIKNLRLVAYARGIDGEELEKLETKIPFYIVAEDGFSLRFEGKKKTMVFKSDSASLNIDNSITLKGNITLSVDSKKTSLGREATVSVSKDRIISIETYSGVFKVRF